jgi:outer membrane biosynthesis protein TonB
MANKIDTLKAEIAEMEEVANDPGTPDDVKKALAPAIKNAKAQLNALTPTSPAKKEKAAPAPAKPAPVAQPVVKKSDATKPSSLKDCQDLLEKYQDKKKTDKKRVQKRANQGKPPTLTPSEVVKKTATSVKAKVIEIKKADSKLPASEITKITNGIISTIKGTLSGMASAVTKKAFLSDIINELRKIERNLPATAMHGMMLAAGGRTKNAINRDRMFQSQQEWEKDYQRKGEPGRRYMEDGGEIKDENGYLKYTIENGELVIDNIKVFKQRIGTGKKLINKVI